MAEVPVAGIGGTVRVVPQIASGHDAKGADRREGPALRTPQRVFAVARVVDDLAVPIAWQVQAACEHVTRVVAVLPRVAIAVPPAVIVTIAGIVAIAAVVTIIMVMILDAVRNGATADRQIVYRW